MVGERSLGSLGDVLLREGLITDSQLTTALQVQKETEKSLGRVLVEMGLITERVRMRLLQQKLGYDIVQINPQRVDRMVLDYLPKSLALKHRLVPIRLDFDNLVVAMEDPSDVTIVDHLKQFTGFRVKPVLAGVEEIEAVLAQYPDEPVAVEVQAEPSRLSMVLGRVLLLALLALPFLVFFLWLLPNNPQWIERLTGTAFSVDVFIFTLLGWGIYAVICFELWSLIFQRRRTKAPTPPTPPAGML